MTSTVRAIAIGGLVIILCVVAYLGYWWLARDTTERQYDVNTQTQQYQAGVAAQLRDDARGWQVATDPAQKSLLASQFCTQYLIIIDPKPADLVQSNQVICTK
jgi:hypothetical protein